MHWKVLWLKIIIPQMYFSSEQHTEELRVQKNEVETSSLVSPGESSHLGGRAPFRCQFCPYKSRFYCLLDRHTRFKHFGERPFPCSVCPKKFSLKTDLQRHMLIHMQKKPFACSHCNNTYRHRWLLKKHMEAHEVSK